MRPPRNEPKVYSWAEVQEKIPHVQACSICVPEMVCDSCQQRRYCFLLVTTGGDDKQGGLVPCCKGCLAYLPADPLEAALAGRLSDGTVRDHNGKWVQRR